MKETIDSRQILAFCTLVQTGSFTETARELNLTQSAISHSVKNLEDDLGCQLVTRSGRKIHITDDGDEFYRQAQGILHQMESVRIKIRDRDSWGRGRLRIGASTTACQFVLPKVLREFNESFPDCILSITPADTPQLVEHLRRHEIDLAIVIDPGPMNEISMLPLFTDELVVITSPIHPFVQKRHGSNGSNCPATSRFIQPAEPHLQPDRGIFPSAQARAAPLYRARQHGGD